MAPQLLASLVRLACVNSFLSKTLVVKRLQYCCSEANTHNLADGVTIHIDSKLGSRSLQVRADGSNDEEGYIDGDRSHFWSRWCGGPYEKPGAAAAAAGTAAQQRAAQHQPLQTRGQFALLGLQVISQKFAN